MKNPPVGTLHGDGTEITNVTATRRSMARVPAFVGLARHHGGVYAENLDDGLSIERALEAARLDYTVVHADGTASHTAPEPVITATGVFPAGTVFTARDTVRRPLMGIWPDGGTAVFGHVANRYRIVQPVEAADLGHAIVGMNPQHKLVAAGTYGEPLGTRMYFAFRVGTVTVGGQDRHDMYFHLLNSFDGHSGLTVMFAPIRLECTNQTSMHFGRLSQRQIIQHSGDVSGKIEALRAALNKTFTWTERFKQTSEFLLNMRMGERELREFADALYLTPANVKTPAGEQAWATRRDNFVAAALGSEANTFGRGTRYAAYQAVTFMADHGKWENPANPWAGLRRPTALWSRLMDGGKEETLKIRAGKLLLSGLN